MHKVLRFACASSALAEGATGQVLAEELAAMGEAGLAGAPDAMGELMKRVYKKTGTSLHWYALQADAQRQTRT